MSMTMTQKILAAHAGKREVHAGELIMAKLDLVLANDITAPVAIGEFPKFGREQVFDRDKIALVPDHFAPNKDVKAAEQCACMRRFARGQGIANYFETGHDCGVEHALLPEKGLVTAGDCVIGADSHTCTYGALGEVFVKISDKHGVYRGRGVSTDIIKGSILALLNAVNRMMEAAS